MRRVGRVNMIQVHLKQHNETHKKLFKKGRKEGV
jgi:hypothetical protein